MGKGFSKPATKQPSSVLRIPALNELYVPIGCVGLTREEYDMPRLEMAPFLFYQFETSSNKDLYNQVVGIIKKLQPDAQAVADPRNVYGPIYLFVAYDVERGNAEVFLFFPSMTKSGRKWPNYHFLGMSHRWMFRIMNGPDYRIKRPMTSCGIRPFDQSMEMGCRTEESFTCSQSKKMHKKMGLFKRRKNKEAYPAIYFRMYSINLLHPSVRDVIHPSGFSTLQRNILPGDIDMFTGCRYMLVSPRQRFFYVLTRSMLTLYRNLGSEDVTALCMKNKIPKYVVPVQRLYFNGNINTRAVLEEGELRVYSQRDEEATDELVFKSRATKNDTNPPAALVLEDSGRLVVYDNTNNVVSSSVFNQPSDASTTTQVSNEFTDEYDPVRDRKERLVQLVAYMKLLKMYRDIPQLSIEQQGVDIGADIAFNETITQFDSRANYVQRLEKLLDYLFQNNMLHTGDINRYGFMLELRDDGSSTGSPESLIPSNTGLQVPVFAGLQVPAQSQPKTNGMAATGSAGPANGDETEPEDPCDDIQSDEDREKCVDEQEQMRTQAQNEADASLHDMEVSLGSGALSIGDVAQLIRSNNIPQEQQSRAEATGAQGTTSTNTKPACPPTTGAYNLDSDLHCRLVALRDSIKRSNRQLHVISMHEQRQKQYIDASEAVDEYHEKNDRTSRLNSLKARLSNYTLR